jgi:hypothetical protein
VKTRNELKLISCFIFIGKNLNSLPMFKLNNSIGGMKMTHMINFDSTLTKEKIETLVEIKELERIQFSEPVKLETLELLNEIFFSARPDVELRVYGFYTKICNLSFVKKMTNVIKFSADCLMDVINEDAICEMKQLKELSFDVFEQKDFSFMENVTANLESLYIGATRSKSPDIKFIANFSSLKKIYIEGQTKNIDQIYKLVELEDVTLRSVTIKSLDCLIPLKKMRSLDIKLGGITNFKAIENNPLISYLELWHVRGLSDLSFVSTLTGLNHLFLQSLPHVKKIPTLTMLMGLKRITIEQMKGLTDFTAVEFAPALEEFYHYVAMNTEPSDYLPVLRNRSLKYIGVGFSSTKKHKEFEELAFKHGKIISYGRD